MKTSDTKRKERERIAADIARFEAAGGQIEQRRSDEFGNKFSYEEGTYQSGMKYLKPTGAKLDYNKTITPQ